MLTRKEFERQYSAELLPSSMENYGIGDIWDWKGFLVFNWHLVPQDDNLYDVCGDNALKQTLQSIPLSSALMADIDITDDFKADASLTIPTTNLSLKDVLTKDNVDSFQFASVQGRNSIGCRTQMSNSVEALKNTNFDRYKQRIRDMEIVLGLFYAGSVVLSIKKTVSNQADIETKLKSIPGVSLSIDTSDSQTIIYSLNNAKCPFAAQFIKGRDL